MLSSKDSVARTVIVFASNYFPKETYNGYDKSLIRQYLNNGGRIVVLGNNPLLYHTDSAGNVLGFNFLMLDSVLNIKTGPNDLRSMGGIQPAFATDEGLKWGVQKSWTSFIPLQEDQVDVVLGKDENGMASSWVKKFSSIKGSGFIQLWIDPDFIDDMSPILKVAEYGMD